jgi:hypothetical protein
MRVVLPPAIGNGPTTPVSVRSLNLNTFTTSRRNHNGRAERCAICPPVTFCVCLCRPARRGFGSPKAEFGPLSGRRQVLRMGRGASRTPAQRPIALLRSELSALSP